MKNNKLYPTVGQDMHGIKFFFDAEFPEKSKKHFTIRFSGNPLLILEYLYSLRGGTEFTETYAMAKGAENAKCDKENLALLKQTAKDVSEFMEAMALMAENKKSPFVVYLNDYSDNR